MTADEKLKRLSARIARALFTDGKGDRADRLVLEKWPAKFPGGGWSESAAAHWIENEIRAAIKEDKKT